MSGPTPPDNPLPEQPDKRRGPLLTVPQVGETRLFRNESTVALSERFTLMADAIMRNRPEPPALVEGMIPEQSLSVVYGEPGKGKSFLVLDLAYSIATGIDWLGKRVLQGPVVYIAGEGVGGLPKRIRAWRIAHGVKGDVDVHFMSGAAQLLQDGDVESLVRLLKLLQERPVLVIVDTLARAMAGGNENDAGDMGKLIRAADTIREELGTAVLLVHHPTKGDRNEPRGSSALEGAADFMLAVERTDTMLYLTERKNKEYEPIREITVRLQPHEDSCVVVHQPSDPHDKRESPKSKKAQWPFAGISEREYTVLEVLGNTTDPISKARYRDLALETKGVAQSTFYEAVNQLIALGYIQDDDKGISITEAGRKVLQDYSNGIPS